MSDKQPVKFLKYIELARTKSEALDHIYSLFKQNIKSGNASGEGNAGERWKTTIGLISKKATLLVHHTFFVHFFAVVFHDYNVKLAETSYSHVLLRKCRTFSRSLFSHCRSFSPCIGDRWHFSLSPPLLLEENSNQKMSPLFISRSRSLSPYFSLSFAGLSPTFSFSLSFSCSIFQICGHDNYSELNTLENTDTETISAFRLFRRLYFTRRRWLCDFPSK